MAGRFAKLLLIWLGKLISLYIERQTEAGAASTRSHNVTEREEFEAWWTRDLPPEYSSLRPRFFKSNENGEYRNPRCQGAWEVWQAARRTTPDREAIIEECAKVCEDVAAVRNTTEMRSGAELCVGAIRALKTAPNGEKK